MKKILKIKEYLESFGDTEFISVNVDKPNEAIFKRISTNKIYSEPVCEDINGKIVLNVVNGKPIGAIAKEKDLSYDFASSIVGVIEADESNFGERYKKLRDAFMLAPMNESIEASKTTKKENVSRPQRYNGILAKQVNAVNEAFDNFKKSIDTLYASKGDKLILGEKDDSLANKFNAQLEEVAKKIGVNAAKYASIVENVGEIVSDEKIKDIVIKAIFENRSEAELTKILATERIKSGFKMNVVKTVGKIMPLCEGMQVFDDDQFSPSNFPGINPNDEPNLRDVGQKQFFKFKMGIFQPKDLEVMMRELQIALSHQGELDQDEMVEISTYLRTIEYMYRTGQIVDALLATMIEEFNKKYSGDYKGPLDRGLGEPGICGSVAKGIEPIIPAAGGSNE